MLTIRTTNYVESPKMTFPTSELIPADFTRHYRANALPLTVAVSPNYFNTSTKSALYARVRESGNILIGGLPLGGVARKRASRR